MGKPRVEHRREDYALRLFERLRLGWLLAHSPPSLVWSAYVFINGCMTIGLLALLAELTRTPFVFPSLGPSAYLFFFSPLGEPSTPRNAILGHAIGLVCGYGAFRLLGLSAFPQGFHTTVFWPHVLAAALSLGATGAVMVLCHVNHPPAGATTMIVSLGILSKPEYLVAIEIAIVLLTLQAFVINRLAGLPYPIWQNKE